MLLYVEAAHEAEHHATTPGHGGLGASLAFPRSGEKSSERGSGRKKDFWCPIGPCAISLHQQL